MKLLSIYGLLIICLFGSLIHPTKLESANLTTTKDTLSTSRLSFLGTVDPSGTTAGSSNVKLITPAYDPGGAAAVRNSITTANLRVGDVLSIGSSVDYYTVVTIADATNFTVDPVLLATDDDANDPIYLRIRPTQTFTFTTTSALLDGSFRILLPADADGATVWTDGNPDDGGFDFTASPTVTGTNVTGYAFAAGTGTVSAGAGCTTPALYHCYDVGYTGTGAVGANISIVISTNAPIAPSPGDTTEATAETYTYIVQNRNSAGVVVDSNKGRIALIEPVRVTATVDPTISMTICGDTDCAVQDVDPGDIVDGETLSNNTGGTSSGTAVALGTLDLLAARLQAQKITVATNGSTGYALTAIDDGNLRRNADTINDNVTPPTGPAVLNTPGTEAYGIHPSGTHVNGTTWGTAGATTNKYSGTDTSNILTLVTYTTGPTVGVDTYVTYKANISPITAQGDYEHSLTYIATATF
ncbi:MAG: hypothetical protein WCG44_03630 [bacterium]